ncbi:hypothetical protein Tco_1332835, partial [Tanacetum coccineum]
MSIFKVPMGVLNHLESIRRNFFNGVDGSNKKMVWISWKKVLTSKQKGGLGLSSLFAINRALMSSPWLDILREVSSLKSKGIDLCALIRKKVRNGEDTLFWEEHWIGEKELRIQFPRLYALETCKHISVAAKMRHNSLSSSLRCPLSRGAKEDQFCLINLCLADLILPQMNNYWYWSLEGSSEFSVISARILINDSSYPTGDVLTRW